MQSESIQAKIVRECIRMAAGSRLLGPKIKTGQLQRALLEKEPTWRPPSDMTWERIELPHFAVEILTPEKCGENALLQLHGGGYVNPLRNVYRNFAKKYAAMCGGINVFSADYRVAPEHTHPAALLDAVETYRMILEQGYTGEHIYLAGDSAGGGLAVALCMWLREQGMPLPARVVLMSPWLDMTAAGESYEENFEKDPMFGGTKESMIYRGDYLGDYSPQEPYLSPLFGEFTGLPPMLVQVGEIEMIRSDGECAADKIKKAGGRAVLQIYQGMFHVFQMGLDQIPESANAWEEIEKFLSD